MRKVIAILLIMFLVACLPVPQVKPVDDADIEDVEVNETEVELESVDTETPVDDTPVKTVTEGDFVNFPNLKATDPDGDPIDYTFSKPLNEKGEWQTKVGDAGEYIITIIASDGENKIDQNVKLVVNAQNAAPVISIADAIESKEGEEVVLAPVVTDPDGDNVTTTYSGWMNSDKKTSTFTDAGSHKVKISATDGLNIAEKEIYIIVRNVNRVPVLDPIEDINIKEGDKVIVTPNAIDPDGDKIKFAFSTPFDEAGKWQTKIGDEGNYEITVTADDDTDKTDVTFSIDIEALNKAPLIEIANINVKEGETVTLTPKITDADGDEFSVEYSGWMTSNTKTTDFHDAGTYTVVITAKDSFGNEAKKDVTVTVENINRPPVFDPNAFI